MGAQEINPIDTGGTHRPPTEFASNDQDMSLSFSSYVPATGTSMGPHLPSRLHDPSSASNIYSTEASSPKLESPVTNTSWLIPRGLMSRLTPLLSEMWQLLDVALAVATLYIVARIHEIGFSRNYMALALVTAVLMLFVYSWSDLFYRLRTRTLSQEAGRLLQAWAKVLGSLLLIGYLSNTMSEFHRTVMLLWVALSFVLQLLIHIITRKILHALRRRGYNVRHVLVVGCGSPMERYIRFVERNPWLGITVDGYVAEPFWLVDNAVQDRSALSAIADASSSRKRANRIHGAELHGKNAAVAATPQLRQLGRLGDIARLVDQLGINEIYVTLPLERSSDAEAVMRALVNVPVNVNWIPDLSLAQLLSTRTDKLGDHPLILLSDSRIDRHGRLVKRLEDVVLSALLIVLFAPLMLLIACAIKAESPGPVIFQQRRHGLNGQPIVVWKFRTMSVDPLAELTKQATRDDQRITPIGRFLRRWSLDELPQFFNVLQGRMSLVGPRPHPLWLDDQFSKIVHAYMQRHRVKPGLTGWAQVHGYRGETDTWEKMEARVRYDLYYITHWSPWLDIKILARTVPATLNGKNAY